MTLDQFYRAVGGTAAEAAPRLGGADATRRFLRLFPLDDSFPQLSEALGRGDVQAAFRAAHTLKGVAQNLGFDRLYAASVPLTEAMRGAKPLDDFSLLAAVQSVQGETLAAIAKLDDTP